MRNVETIAPGRAVRQLRRLRRRYGSGRWRRGKGIAAVRLQDGTVHTAEIHCYEAHDIRRRELKIKFPLLDREMKRPRKAPVRFAVCIKNRGYKPPWRSGSCIASCPIRRQNGMGTCASSTRAERTMAMPPTASSPSCAEAPGAGSREGCILTMGRRTTRLSGRFAPRSPRREAHMATFGRETE